MKRRTFLQAVSAALTLVAVPIVRLWPWRRKGITWDIPRARVRFQDGSETVGPMTLNVSDDDVTDYSIVREGGTISHVQVTMRTGATVTILAVSDRQEPFGRITIF